MRGIKYPDPPNVANLIFIIRGKNGGEWVETPPPPHPGIIGIFLFSLNEFLSFPNYGKKSHT